MTASLSNFHASLRAVRAVTKKTEAEIVTRAARDVAYRAASFTPKSSAAKIRSDLRRGKLLIRLAASRLKRRQGRYSRAEHQAEMGRIERSRTRNVAALRAGWSKCILDLGGTFRGSRLRASGSAFDSFGKRATIAHLVSTIRNAVVTTNHQGQQTGAGDIPVAVAALHRAVEFVTLDRFSYAHRKLAQAMRTAV